MQLRFGTIAPRSECFCVILLKLVHGPERACCFAIRGEHVVEDLRLGRRSRG